MYGILFPKVKPVSHEPWLWHRPPGYRASSGEL